jgi:peptidoglycan/LPS O-acetylase OafA/YrhL
MRGTWSLATEITFSPLFVLVTFLVAASLFACVVLAAVLFSFKK